MKKTNFYVAVASTALSLLLTSVCARAATVNWSNINGDFNGVGLLSGTLVPTGSLVRVGSFTITPAQIAANSTNLSFLNSNFVEFRNTTIGTGGYGAGYWTSDAVTSNNLTLQLGIANTQIYYWVFNTPTLAAATQTGVFTSPNNPAWIFPSDAAVPNSTTTDITDVPNAANGIIIGSYNRAISNGVPQYNLAVVPEPSSVILLSIGAVGAFAMLRRRAVKA